MVQFLFSYGKHLNHATPERQNPWNNCAIFFKTFSRNIYEHEIILNLNSDSRRRVSQLIFQLASTPAKHFQSALRWSTKNANLNSDEWKLIFYFSISSNTLNWVIQILLGSLPITSCELFEIGLRLCFTSKWVNCWWALTRHLESQNISKLKICDVWRK